MSRRYRYDVFISHAYEDKEEIGNALNEELRRQGIKVWYSGNDMKVGQPLSHTILNHAIPQSKYGVVIFSDHYFKAEWARRELNAMHMQQDRRGYEIILPIWHKVDEDAVKVEFPYLVESFALHSAKGLDHIVAELVKVAQAPVPKTIRTTPPDTSHPWVKMMLAFLAVCIVASAIIFYSLPDLPVSLVEETAKERIARLESTMDADTKEWMINHDTQKTSLQKIMVLSAQFIRHLPIDKTYYLKSNDVVIHGREEVKQFLRKDPETNIYSANNFHSFLDTSNAGEFEYAFINAKISEPEIGETEQIDDNLFVCPVYYKNPIRSTIVRMKKIGTRKIDCNIRCYAMPVMEKYVFEKSETGWRFLEVKE